MWFVQEAFQVQGRDWPKQKITDLKHFCCQSPSNGHNFAHSLSLSLARNFQINLGSSRYERFEDLCGTSVRCLNFGLTPRPFLVSRRIKPSFLQAFIALFYLYMIYQNKLPLSDTVARVTIIKYLLLKPNQEALARKIRIKVLFLALLYCRTIQ